MRWSRLLRHSHAPHPEVERSPRRRKLSSDHRGVRIRFDVAGTSRYVLVFPRTYLEVPATSKRILTPRWSLDSFRLRGLRSTSGWGAWLCLNRRDQRMRSFQRYGLFFTSHASL